METNVMYNSDGLEILKSLPNHSIDLIFTDPPYALGSDVIIRQDGKPDYKKAVDFMSKWNQPDGQFWEEWFKEANRVLKYGGHCLMFGLDRQLMLYKYYACFAGFIEKQSLYWYFISNFPKASDLSKNIDKNAGAEREIIKKRKQKVGNNNNDIYSKYSGIADITTPATDLAKKYDGMKYSIAPLKQTNETIMVFQKPYKTGSCLHDTIALENGDNEITCGAVNVDGNRVAIDKNDPNLRLNQREKIANERTNPNGIYGKFGSTKNPDLGLHNSKGRYASQTFLSNGTKEILDKQSGVSKGNLNLTKETKPKKTVHTYQKGYKEIKGKIRGYGDTAGCSKVCHVVDYTTEDIYIYCPKTSQKERGTFNNHPTVKPIALLRKILSYFKTPNKQIILDTFVGSGSIPISAIKEGYEFIGVELDKDYYEIAKKRIFDEQKQLTLF